MNKKSFLKTLTLGLILAVLAGSALSVFSFQTAKAATTITVNSTADIVANDGKCSLREAITAANADKASGSMNGECPAGSLADTIQLLPNTTYTLNNPIMDDDDTSADGDLDFKSNITLQVNGTGQATIQAQNFKDRVFHIISGTIIISNVIIKGGNLPSGNGAGISNSGNLTLKDSYITGNTSSGQGGGLYNATGATLVVTGSTIAGNTATSDGGGLSNYGTATLTNTTVSGNTSNGSGGGIVNRGTITLNAVTITANQTKTTSGNGGGVKAASGTFNIKDTLIAGNSSAATTPYADCAGTLNSYGYNLIQKTAGCTLNNKTGNPTTGDILNPANVYLDSQLNNNGGPTPTYALLAGSPAINAGVCKDTAGNTITVDQRGVGFPRPQGPACDIGAYELVSAPALTLDQKISTSGSGPWSASINVSGNSQVYYQFTVTNTGNVAFSSINITNSDPKVTTASCTFTSALPAGGTTTCVVGPVTAAPGTLLPNLTTITNTATASGVYSGQPNNSNSSSASYTVTDPVQTGPTYNVNSFNDVTTVGVCTVGKCSLRDAILAANAKPNGTTPDTIQFKISGTITLTGPLDPITDPVIIDGSGQQIVLDGTSAGASTPGLTVQASNSKVCNLTIQNFKGDGITITGSNATICNNQIINNGGAGVRLSSGNGDAITGNVISGNSGGGIAAYSGTNNAFQNNSIYSNPGHQGIDLNGDGVSLNHAGTITGPNNYQNYPVLTLVTSAGSTTRLKGILASAASQSYTIDLYTNPTCNPTFFGDGKTYLGSFPVTTELNGLATFDQTFNTGTTLLYGLTATATGSNGTSEFSYCRPVTSPNLNWAQAQPLSLGSPTLQNITDRFEEKWFKFPVTPGSVVHVRLDGLQGSAVSLHLDPNPIYNSLINPQSSAVLSVEAANSAFLPSGSLPSGSLPSGSLPSGSLPSGSLPSGSLDTWFLPSGSLPSGSLPSGSLPSGSLPSGSLPSGSLPSGSLDAYASAARRSLLGISMNPYVTIQTIDRNTYDLQSNLYVRVVGPYNLATPFTLKVTVDPGVCSTITAVPSGLAVINGTVVGSGKQTLILTDSRRLDPKTINGPDPLITAALADLGTLAIRPDVNGVVIDLHDPMYQRVVWANNQADTNPACPAAKNMVATEIKAVIDAYRPANSLQYIVLAGGANVIPFYQVPDVSGLANEKDYVAPVASNTPSEAGLKTNLVEGQDFYGSQVNVTQGGLTLAIPNLAVGRLVDTAADISTAVNNYIATGGVVIPHSSLVTGYDFVADAAGQIATEFNAGTTSTADMLITAQGLPPSDPSAWTADQLLTKLLTRHDIVSLSGHFSAGNLLAADYTTQLSAAGLTASQVDLKNVLVLALGCHGGYTIPNSDLLTGASPDPDWAKIFLRNGAAGYMTSTGYAYGDTQLTMYGERLFVILAQQLRTGQANTAISLGQALVAAKRQYLAETAQLTGIDQKTIVETTLYGLPMMKINMPGARIPPTAETSIVGSFTSVGSFNLTTTSVPLPSPIPTTPFSLTNNPLTLHDPAGGPDVMATYLSGANGVVANPFEPVYPKQIYDVSANGQVLRGVAFRGGTYTDQTGVVPLTSAATTETSTTHLSYNTQVFYPTQTWMANYNDAITGGNTRLVAIPAQFRSSAPGATDGTLRTFIHLDLQLYYLPSNWADPSSSATVKAAAVSAAPTILGASALAGDTSLGVVKDCNNKDIPTGGSIVIFCVNAQADGSAGVQAVWVLYTGKPGSAYYGTWYPFDLARDSSDPTLWTGTLTGVTSPADLLFMVQAVGGAGLTTLATNLGAYYGVTPANAGSLPPPAATTLKLETSPTIGTYLQNAPFTLSLKSAGQPLGGQPVTLDIGGQQALAITDPTTGLATITLKPVVAPGSYTVQASFPGNASYLGSTATPSPFTLNKDSTTLTLSPTFVATLQDSSSRPLGGKSVLFVVSDASPTIKLVRSVIADYQGHAPLGLVLLPPGTYTVDAYFSGTIPLPPPLKLSDDYYLSSSSPPSSLTISAPPITASATKADTTAYTAGAWTNQTVTVHFTCINTAGSGVTSCPADQAFPNDGSFTANGTLKDNAGNSASASFGPIQVDKTAPTITATATKADNTAYTAGAWTNQAVTVSFTCSDAGSGVASCPPDQPFSADGSFTANGTATDNAGNPANTSFSVKIDKTAPTIVAAATTAPNAAGWYNSDVTVTFTCTDALSGTPAGACPDQVLSTEGAAVASTAQTVTDLAGNTSLSSNVVTAKIDKTAPTIVAAATTAPNAAGWYNSNVTVHFTCNDALSGTPAGACPDQVLNTEGAAVASTAQTVTDAAGNTSSSSNVVTVKIDKTAPTLAASVSPNPVILNGSGTASPGATDSGSGIASQSCGSVSTSPVGPKTVQCTATDIAGNPTTVNVSYNVTYRFDGFLQPINDTAHTQVCGSPCTVSIFKGGSTVPVKFQLKDANGNVVQAASLPIWLTPQLGGPTTAPVDESLYTDKVDSGSNYGWDGQQYHYNWGTQSFATGYYWRIGVQLDDGQTYFVNIGLR